MPDIKPKTSLERSRGALKVLREKAPLLADKPLVDFFEKFVGDNQNTEPDGKNDGTLSLSQWMALNQVVKALRELRSRVEIAEKELAKQASK